MLLSPPTTILIVDTIYQKIAHVTRTLCNVVDLYINPTQHGMCSSSKGQNKFHRIHDKITNALCYTIRQINR